MLLSITNPGASVSLDGKNITLDGYAVSEYAILSIHKDSIDIRTIFIALQSGKNPVPKRRPSSQLLANAYCRTV